MAQLQQALIGAHGGLPVNPGGFEGEIILPRLIRERVPGIVERKRVVTVVDSGVVQPAFQNVFIRLPPDHTPRGQLISRVGVTAA